MNNMIMPITKLVGDGSHFELVNGKELPEKNIVQIWPEKVYVNDKTGYAVFLCEVESEE